MTEALTVGWVMVDVARLHKAQWNYKTDDDAKLEKLREKIKRNGQLVNVIIRELEDGTLEVVNGNHRQDAFIAEKVERVMAYNLGRTSVTHAKRVAWETNGDEDFDADPLKVARLFRDMAKEYGAEDLTKTMSVKPADIARYINMAEFSWEQYGRKETPTHGDKDAAQPEPEQFVTIKLDLPEAVASAFSSMLERINTAVLGTPTAARVQAVEAVTAHLAGMSDAELRAALTGG